MYVANQSVEFAITIGRPTREITRQVTNSSQEIHPCGTRAIQDLHQDARGYRGQTSPNLGFRLSGRLRLQSLAFLRHFFVELINALVRVRSVWTCTPRANLHRTGTGGSPRRGITMVIVEEGCRDFSQLNSRRQFLIQSNSGLEEVLHVVLVDGGQAARG